MVALAGDISQMYHQLVLREEDRPLHRFLWRNLDPSKEPEVYEFLRFVFGGCYCPFCARYTWQKHAQDHKEEYPLAANAVEKHCYIDDVMPSIDSIEVAKETRRQLSEMGDKAGFHICKWCPIVLKSWKMFLSKIIRPTLVWRRMNCQQQKLWAFDEMQRTTSFCLTSPPLLMISSIRNEMY